MRAESRSLPSGGKIWIQGSQDRARSEAVGIIFPREREKISRLFTSRGHATQVSWTKQTEKEEPVPGTGSMKDKEQQDVPWESRNKRFKEKVIVHRIHTHTLGRSNVMNGQL